MFSRSHILDSYNGFLEYQLFDFIRCCRGVFTNARKTDLDNIRWQIDEDDMFITHENDTTLISPVGTLSGYLRRGGQWEQHDNTQRNNGGGAMPMVHPKSQLFGEFDVGKSRLHVCACVVR